MRGGTHIFTRQEIVACIRGELIVQTKLLILLVGVIVVVVGVSGVGVYFSLVSSFTPPVDISGIDISSALP